MDEARPWCMYYYLSLCVWWGGGGGGGGGSTWHMIWHIFQSFNYEEILLCEDHSYSSFVILWKLMLHVLKVLRRWNRDRKFYEEVNWKEWNERSLWYSGYEDDLEMLVTGTRWIGKWREREREICECLSWKKQSAWWETSHWDITWVVH